MLIQLTIRNYALIRELEFRPGTKMNAITGETGAGKSILLGAIGLLLGNRADTKVLLDESEKCVTEGVFSIAKYDLHGFFEENELDYQPETILRREISPAGKSRAFINDTPVTLDILRNLGNRLMDIHSQHENLDLGSQRYQLNLIDAFAGSETLVKAYQDSWIEFRVAQAQFETLTKTAAELGKESDFVRFQLDELEKAELKEGEETDLDTRLRQADNAGLIRQNLLALATLMEDQDYAVLSQLSAARALLQPLAPLNIAYAELLKRVESLRTEAADIQSEAVQESEAVQFDAAETNQMRTRLDFLYTLQRKHRVDSSAELMNIREEYRNQSNRSTSIDEELRTAEGRLIKMKQSLAEKSNSLSKVRQKSFGALEKEMSELLKELGIPDAVIKISHSVSEAGPMGNDQVELKFSANKGIAPRPLAACASGGEFSRLMLVVKHILASKKAMPTLLMDEIDTGVSGDIALRMGNLMQKMSDQHQVLAISHLPQIAARAHTHFVVFKEKESGRASSNIRLLSSGERVTEIARILSGTNPSESALQYARELMT